MVTQRKHRGKKAAVPESDLLTSKELSHLLHISRSLIYWLIEQGHLPPVRIGRALRFRREDVERYLREQAEQHKS